MTIWLWGIHSSHNYYITELWLWRAINQPILNLASLFFCNSQRKRLSIFPKESMCLVERSSQHPPENNGVSQNCREVSYSRRCTTCTSLHLHEEIRLRFSNSQHFSHIELTTISFRLSPSRFLVVVFFFVVRFSLNFKPPFKCCLEIEKCT